MDQTLIVRGRYAGRTFIPDGPLPDAEGAAELVITPAPHSRRVRRRRLRHRPRAAERGRHPGPGAGRPRRVG